MVVKIRISNNYFTNICFTVFLKLVYKAVFSTNVQSPILLILAIGVIDMFPWVFNLQLKTCEILICQIAFHNDRIKAYIACPRTPCKELIITYIWSFRNSIYDDHWPLQNWTALDDEKHISISTSWTIFNTRIQYKTLPSFLLYYFALNKDYMHYFHTN